MINFCQIILGQYCDTCGQAGTGWFMGFSKDFILPIVLTIIAAYVAFQIFVLETRRDKKNELERKTEERNDKLLYLAMMIRNCIKISEQQAGNVKTVIGKIREDDLTFHEMGLVQLNDLKRVSEVLSLEQYMLAYVNTDIDNRKDSIKQFRAIISCNDYLFGVFLGITDQLKKAQEFDHERKLAYKEKFETTFKGISDLMVEWNGPQPLAEEILRIYQAFSGNEPEDRYNLQYPFDFFFQPYAVFFNHQLDNFILRGPVYHNLSHNFNQGIQIFNQIKAQNQSVAADLEGDVVGIEKAIVDMQQNAQKLMELLD